VTSPVEESLVRCPRCRHLYRDWWRASINPQLDPEMVADTEYLDSASTAICPACGAKAAVGELTLGRGLWRAEDPAGFPHWTEVGADPTRSLRVVSLNLRATPGRRLESLIPLINLLGSQQPDVVLVQECRAGWIDLIGKELGLDGISTHELLEPTPGLPADGCAVAVRAPLRILGALPVQERLFRPAAIEALIGPDTPPGYDQLPAELLVRFHARSLIARVADGLNDFVAASFHATPGTGRFGPKPGIVVRNWKPFFHGGVAVALAELNLPFVFAIDANEPRSETIDSVTFHWRDGRPGARKFAALMGLEPVHPGRDLLREHLRRHGLPAAADTYLALTYTTHRGGQAGRRRFDSMWASPEFSLHDFSTHYEDALAAGTDHAMLVAALELGPSHRN
jgi:hypothetical protein